MDSSLLIGSATDDLASVLILDRNAQSTVAKESNTDPTISLDQFMAFVVLRISNTIRLVWNT